MSSAASSPELDFVQFSSIFGPRHSLQATSPVLVISFLALSRNGFWCINLLLIFGHSGEKPRYGKNSRLLQGFPTSPRHVKLTWGHLVTVPWPKPLQRHVDMLLTGGN